MVWVGCTSVTKTDFFSLIVHTQFYWSAVLQIEKFVVVNVLRCGPFAVMTLCDVTTVIVTCRGVQYKRVCSLLIVSDVVK